MATQRNTLAFATGHRFGFQIQQIGNIERFGCLVDPFSIHRSVNCME